VSLYGGLPKTATCHVGVCSDDTTLAATKTRPTACLSAPVIKSSSELMQLMPCLFGEGRCTAATAKKALNAQYLETKGQSCRQSLSDRQTQSLITAGLIKGTTPLFVRKTSGLAIRDFALLPLDGGSVG
jgi:hypothetical protein